MFIVKDYTKYGFDYYFCRTIEKAKEIFDRVFWEWVKKQTSSDWPDTPQEYDCETWEELLQECWEDGMNWEDVVRCESIAFEEDKN